VLLDASDDVEEVTDTRVIERSRLSSSATRNVVDFFKKTKKRRKKERLTVYSLKPR
jgi:hypothetical protein